MNGHVFTSSGACIRLTMAIRPHLTMMLSRFVFFIFHKNNYGDYKPKVYGLALASKSYFYQLNLDLTYLPLHGGKGTHAYDKGLMYKIPNARFGLRV